MTLAIYDVGDTVRLTASYTDTGGSAVNPTSVKFVLRDPTGSESTRASGSTSVSNPATGSFHTDFFLTLSGTYNWRSYSTGSLNTASEDVFVVRKQWVAAST